MSAAIRFALALGVLGFLGASVAAQAQSLDDAKAREIISPFYALFNLSTRGDVAATEKSILTPDFETCSGYMPSDCRDRDTLINIVEGYTKTMPDMHFDIKEVLASGNRVVVRGELTGTPAGDLFGVPHTGKSFRIMTIDIHTIRDGKIARVWHLENWISAVAQVRPAS